MLKTSTRMLAACVVAFFVSTSLVACGVLTVLRPVHTTPHAHFESDEAAEQAAVERLPRYFAAIDAIMRDGGMRPDRVYPYVTPHHRAELNAAFEELRSSGQTVSGNTVIADEKFLGYAESLSGEARVDIRVCLDVSGLRMLGAMGDDQTPIWRLDRVPYEVRLATSDGDGDALYVTSTHPREGLAPC